MATANNLQPLREASGETRLEGALRARGLGFQQEEA